MTLSEKKIKIRAFIDILAIKGDIVYSEYKKMYNEINDIIETAQIYLSEGKMSSEQYDILIYEININFDEMIDHLDYLTKMI